MGEGLVSRYDGFYGPGTAISLAPDGQMVAPIRKRRFPIVGDGGGVWSQVHIEDAAAATAAAVEHGQPGIYNIVDDDPAPVREWLRWRARWAPSHRGVYHAGSGGSWPVRRRRP